jgi:hypothetical protein
MRHAVIFCVASFVFASEVRGACSETKLPSGVEVGYEATGYYIRVSRGGLARYDGIVDAVARDARSMAIFFGVLAPVRFGPGEWHGPDPLSALTKFGTAAGVKVQALDERAWIIGVPEAIDVAALTVFARPGLGTDMARSVGFDVASAERALIEELPLRETDGAFGRSYIGLTYFWLPDEGPDVFLIQGVPRGSTRDDPAGVATFKVRLPRGNKAGTVECLWRSDQATGSLVPQIKEDFDGDGVRDFVFMTNADYSSDVILSGKDGHLVLAFDGELAVEKRASGAKKIAVETLWDDIPQVGANRQSRFVKGPHLLVFSRERGRFVEAPVDSGGDGAVLKRGTEVAGDERDLLVRVLGGAEQVRVYVEKPAAASKRKMTIKRRSDVEVVELHSAGPGEPMSSDAPPGIGAAHVLFSYESPGYVRAQQELRRKADARR